jgi:hypothetical protein
MYTHIYIRGPLRPSKIFTYTKKYIGPQACATSWYKNRLTSHSKTVYTIHTIRGALSHPQLPLPQEEVVAHPYLPQAVEVAHLQDPPALVAGVH